MKTQRRIPWKKIGKLVADSIAESTAHGLPHIIKRDHWALKIVWSIFFLVSAGICAATIYVTVGAYFEYETVTKTESIHDVPVLFPTVSICNMNQFMTNVSYEFTKSLLVKYKLIKNDTDIVDVIKRVFMDNFLMFRYFAGTNAYNLPDDEFKKQLGLNFERSLFSCSYNLEKCTISDFDWYFDALYGNCFKFNSGRNGRDRVSTRAGKLNGLLIELFIGESDDFYSFAVSSGIHVIIHNKSVTPSYFDGIDAAPGSRTNIAIKREFTSKLAYPYSNCRDDIDQYDSFYVNIIKGLNRPYSQSDCQNLCFQTFTVSQCGCYDSSFAYWNKDSVSPCLSIRDIQCELRSFTRFFQDREAIKACDCPLECENVDYLTSVSYSAYPSVSYAEFLKSNATFRSLFPSVEDLTYETIRRNIMSLNVFYESLTYKHYVEVGKMSIDDLTANIGGTLGLFLGISCLSLVEFFDVLLQVVIITIKSLNAQKVNNVPGDQL